MKSLSLILLVLTLIGTAEAYAGKSSQEWTESLYETDVDSYIDIYENDDLLEIDGLYQENAHKDKIHRYKKNRRWTCVAENFRGRRFVGKADKEHRAHRRAMRSCRNNSRRGWSCEVVRCRKKSKSFERELEEYLKRKLFEELFG